MIWAPICAVVCSASAAGSFLAAFKLYRDSPVRSSSVYWLLTMFFVSFCALAATRASYYVWLATVLPRVPGGKPAQNQLDKMGIHAIVRLRDEQTWAITLVVVVGDTALFGVFLWLFQLTYQLSGLLSQGMDQGEDRERVKIRRIAVVSFLAVAAMFAVELSTGLRFGAYAHATHNFLLAVYVLQIATVVYMVVVVVCIKIKGRDLDAVDGERVVAPIYRRLEGILYVSRGICLPRGE